MNHYLVFGIEPGSSLWADSGLNCRAISPAPYKISFYPAYGKVTLFALWTEISCRHPNRPVRCDEMKCIMSGVGSVKIVATCFLVPWSDWSWKPKWRCSLYTYLEGFQWMFSPSLSHWECQSGLYAEGCCLRSIAWKFESKLFLCFGNLTFFKIYVC